MDLLNPESVSIKTEPGPQEKGTGEMPYEEVEFDLPDIKKEYLQYGESTRTDRWSLNSSSDSESTEKDNATTELQFIADEIANAPVILEKSQTPKIKARKDEAIRNVTRKYEVTFGKALDAKGFLKKINNMKGRLKKKTDLKKTGNKAIKLLEWEKKLLMAMEGDNNPTTRRIGGALQIGIEDGSTQHRVSEASTTREETESAIKPQSSIVKTVESLLPTRKKTATEKYETNETKGLTTKELQRLVLLEQYRTSRVQREYYEKKLERMKREESAANIIVNGGQLAHYNM